MQKLCKSQASNHAGDYSSSEGELISNCIEQHHKCVMSNVAMNVPDCTMFEILEIKQYEYTHMVIKLLDRRYETFD